MVYLFLTDGFEEVEAITPLDYLRRAGSDIKTVGVSGMTVTGSHQIEIKADISPEQVKFDEIEMIILPGGPGTFELEKSSVVQDAIDHCMSNGLPIGAICAAPAILGRRNLLIGKNAVCFPGYESELKGANILLQPVCVDGTIITSQGAGTAQQFAFELVSYLFGEEKSGKLSETVQW